MTTSYDRLWKSTWGDLQRFGPVHRHATEDLLRTVSSLNVRTVLDVGCGSGDNLEALASTGRYELTGADVSPEALNIAHERAPAARLEVLNIERETLSDRFDLVISLQVIEHLLDDVSALRNMAAMATRYVYVATMRGRMRRSELAIGHVRNYSSIELRRKLEIAGLDVIRIAGWGFPFYSPLYRSAIEWLPGGPPSGTMGPLSRVIAGGLYHLYRLNLPGHGDVISALARPA